MNEEKATGYIERFCEESSYEFSEVVDGYDYFDARCCTRGVEYYFDLLISWPDLHESICFLRYGCDFITILQKFEGLHHVRRYRDEIRDQIISECQNGFYAWPEEIWCSLKGGEEFCECLIKFEQFRRFVYSKTALDQMKLLQVTKDYSKVFSLFKYPELFAREYKFHQMWGDFLREPMRSVKNEILKSARFEYPTLIIGDTGTGKELCANAIYNEWVISEKKTHGRNEAPALVSINAASFLSDRVGADLFGYVKGAFTGAVAGKSGIVQEVDQGVLFIDEFGEMPLDVQASILRFVESGVFYKLGGTKEEHLTIKIIAATNNPNGLRDDIAARFRKKIYLPPLGDRLHDLPIMVSAISSKLKSKFSFKSNLSSEQFQKIIEFSFAKKDEADFLKENTRKVEEWIIKALEQNDIENRLNQELRAEEIIEGYKILGNKVKLSGVFNISRPTLDKKIAKFKIEDHFRE
jgi:transcriptional regulator of acetoin/glycerol metabolism